MIFIQVGIERPRRVDTKQIRAVKPAATDSAVAQALAESPWEIALRQSQSQSQGHR